jgi:purine nucleoside phosphorylase
VAAIGIIGGTGLYDIDGFENAHPCGACSVHPSAPRTPGAKRKFKIESAFGQPSDEPIITQQRK